MRTNKDITEDVIDELVHNQILVETGKEFPFEDEPEPYFRRLKNI